MKKDAVKILFLLLALALVLSGCATKIGTSPKGLEIPVEKAAVKLSADIKDGGYRVVDTDGLKKWIDEGKKVTMISTLPLSDDKLFGIIPGAVNGVMPKSEKELTQNDKEAMLKTVGTDKDQTVVIYCGFVACRRSHLGAKVLVENGYTNVYRYPAGIIGWKEAGFPVAK